MSAIFFYFYISFLLLDEWTFCNNCIFTLPYWFHYATLIFTYDIKWSFCFSQGLFIHYFSILFKNKFLLGKWTTVIFLHYSIYAFINLFPWELCLLNIPITIIFQIRAVYKYLLHNCLQGQEISNNICLVGEWQIWLQAVSTLIYTGLTSYAVKLVISSALFKTIYES